jgi:hypothetical protein
MGCCDPMSRRGSVTKGWRKVRSQEMSPTARKRKRKRPCCISDEHSGDGGQRILSNVFLPPGTAITQSQ